jgi:mannose-6-phosphate isomerase-like protein (cupin superfamily)
LTQDHAFEAVKTSRPSGAFLRMLPGERDRAVLEQLRAAGRVPAPPDAEYDYRGCVVQKPWGHEFLAYDTPDVAVWRLRINPGHSTSMHCHPRKRTALMVLAGEALCHVFGRRVPLQAHDVLVLEPGVFHATKSMCADGLELIEVETPRCKTDLVRMNDLYGREGAGYEGLRDMHTERLDRFDHFALNPACDAASTYVDPRQRFALSIEEFGSARLREWSARTSSRALVVLSGQINDADGQPRASLGEALQPSALKGCAPGTASPLVALTLDCPSAAAAHRPLLAPTGTDGPR